MKSKGGFFFVIFSCALIWLRGDQSQIGKMQKLARYLSSVLERPQNYQLLIVLKINFSLGFSFT